MSIVVSVKVQDGVVLASDSCVIHRGRSYFNAEKTINPVRGFPIGVMIAGDGAIGLTSIANHLREYGQMATARSGPWSLSKTHYTLGGVVADMRRYLLDVAKLEEDSAQTTLTVVGYSAGRSLPETWRLTLDGDSLVEPDLIWSEREYGITWDGERECLDRMLCGTPQGLIQVAGEFGLTPKQTQDLHGRVAEVCGSDLVTPGMPLQDAVELARFLVDTTVSFVGFSFTGEPKTVGGMVDIAAITRHDGFRWIQRKRTAAAVGTR
jgi:hypothetical protein